MADMVELGKWLLPTLTVIAQIVFGVVILAFILKKAGMKNTVIKEITEFVKTYPVQLSFVLALTATLGSLFYSEIAGYEPCRLCWFQRILMYPQALLFGSALFWKARDIVKYVLPLGLVGAPLALYHYYIQAAQKLGSCGALDAVDCSVRYTFAYGYITIPLMAFTAFTIILFLMLLKRKTDKN